MDRYITSELLIPFLFSVGLFSSLGVAVGTLSDLANKVFELNMPLTVAMQVLLLKVPEFAAYALPISLLLATLMAYGRMNNDSELIALRSCGVSIYRLVLPALSLSIIVTGITFLFNELVVPAANYQATIIQEKYVPDSRPAFLKDNIFYPQYQLIASATEKKSQKLQTLFYAKSFDGKTMKDLTILKWSGDRLQEIILAETGTWNKIDKVWNLFQGTIYQLSFDAVSYKNIEKFTETTLNISSGAFDLASKARDPYEMNIAQATEYLNILRYSGDEKKILMFEVRTQQKIAFPFICIIFALVGAALATSPQEIGKSTSFGLSVVIVFLYYLLSFLLGGLGLLEIISPFMAAWLPNFCGLGISLNLLRKNSNLN